MPNKEDSSPLDSLIDAAFARFAEVDFELSKLEEPARTMVIITSAQGRIDNGGLRCFFEGDFPGTPPYSLFEEAYARIGCATISAAIKDAVRSFGLASPESCVEERRAYMNDHLDEESQAIRGWDDRGCGDTTVWSKLVQWALERKVDGTD